MASWLSGWFKRHCWHYGEVVTERVSVYGSKGCREPYSRYEQRRRRHCCQCSEERYEVVESRGLDS